MHQQKISEAFGADTIERPARSQREELAQALQASLNGPQVFAESLRRMPGALAGMFSQNNEESFFVAHSVGEAPSWISAFSGETAEVQGLQVFTASPNAENAYALHKAAPLTKPQPLGLAASFGFGDRMGLATPGHAAALMSEGGALAPIFVQQSIREMERTSRTPRDVMAAGTWGAFQSGWDKAVGADADHLKTVEHVEYTAEAGFCFFTIDPSDHVDQQADNYGPAELEARFQALLDGKVEGAADMLSLYEGTSFAVGDEVMTFDRASLLRAAVKYGRALAHVRAMAAHIAKTAGEDAEIELSVDETDQPTSVPEHLFIALELKRFGTSIVSLAPRFIGDFEKGVDYIGDVKALMNTMVQHAAIAAEYGPYKISLHSGSDKFSVYPLLAEATKGMFHVKTAGTSYLEAVRAVRRVDEALFREIISFSRDRFDTDKATYHISAVLDGSPAPHGLDVAELEEHYLNRDNGRQILHVTFGSVLSSPELKPAMMSLLCSNPAQHVDVLKTHLGKHVRLLREGGAE